ncbi:hypothetical protein BC831DRAFT_475235 [Entophlyctis helioformis]|nr:hypothetical protein BC831DRAFT_475235 [Entophlyctis helioformis]
MILDLPDELLLQTLLYIQPNVPSQIDELWTQQTADPLRLRHVWPAAPAPSRSASSSSLPSAAAASTDAQQQQQQQQQQKQRMHTDSAAGPESAFCRTTGFHTAVGHVVGRRTPGLLVFGQVNRRFRRVSHMHPFWSDLAWHRLLPRQPGGPGQTSPKQISAFFTAIAGEPARLFRIRRIILDLSLWHHSVDALVLTGIFKALPRPDRVDTIVLSMRWDTCGDLKLMRTIANKFGHCRRLFIQGGQSGVGGVLFGLDNRSLRFFTRSMSSLTHLFLDGFGGGSFSWTALNDLIKNNAGITALSIGHVRNGVRLDMIARMLPHLRSLSIQFLVFEPSLGSFFQPDSDLDAARMYYEYLNRSRRQCMPQLYGDLSGFENLEHLAFHDFGGSREMSAPVIRRLLDSLPPGKMVQPPGLEPSPPPPGSIPGSAASSGSSSPMSSSLPSSDVGSAGSSSVWLSAQQ